MITRPVRTCLPRACIVRRRARSSCGRPPGRRRPMMGSTLAALRRRARRRWRNRCCSSFSSTSRPSSLSSGLQPSGSLKIRRSRLRGAQNPSRLCLGLGFDDIRVFSESFLTLSGSENGRHAQRRFDSTQPRVKHCPVRCRAPARLRPRGSAQCRSALARPSENVGPPHPKNIDTSLCFA